METFNCAPNVSKNKPRPNLAGNFYSNGSRGIRPVAIEYAPPFPSRAAISAGHTLPWQDRHPATPVPCIGIDTRRSSRGKLCPIALAVASFVVLVAVLAIAGLALYLGVLHTETPSPVITFNCSVKILKGDRFVGALPEKARKYKRQFEALYQRSILGPAFISCIVDKFGNDTQTVYFKLAFNRKKLFKSISNIEKAIKDILLTDAISRSPVFKGTRFDPKGVTVQQILSSSNEIPYSYFASETKSAAKSNVVVKPSNKTSFAIPKRPEVRKDDDGSKSVQGSFKISKTDADITEKKSSDTITDKPRTTASIKKTTSVTSALYKIAAIEKVTKQPNVPKRNSSEATVTPTTQPTNTSSAAPKTTTDPNPLNDEPWIPIMPNLSPSTPVLSNQFFPPYTGNRPIYTSFTNPGLSLNFNEAERLGSTSLRSHPIPVNKIPLTEVAASNTERNVVLMAEQTTVVTKETNSFIEIDTVKHAPESSQQNISSIFHELSSTLDTSPGKPGENKRDEALQGQGQVEVVVDEMEDGITSTAKVPLVTLLPVKSNSGIVGRPIRKRPAKPGAVDPAIEDRSFPSYTVLNLNSDEKKDLVRNDFRIMGILNFATEGSAESRKDDIVRYPKMDLAVPLKEIQQNRSAETGSKSLENNSNVLTLEQIKQLSEISKIVDNSTGFQISDKAISASFTTKQNGLPILTKSFYKKSTSTEIDNLNFTECTNTSVICGDGKCLPATTKCNQLIDCSDGKDEKNCNCADYLESQFLLGKICDGVVDCWDYSDESQCEWCRADQYVCSNSKVCIDKDKICNGAKECPQGDDERQCVTIASSAEAAEDVPYVSEGFIMVRKYGKWGKLCMDNFKDVVSTSNATWNIPDLGKLVCKSMTYQKLESIDTIEEDGNRTDTRYFELTYTSSNESKSSLTFRSSNCDNRQTVKVKCQSLECGARPQVTKHIARVVGGGNAGIGAWPWQAALYKEGEYQCGATLLNQRWLVSAGHCFYHAQEEYWIARLGALRRGTALLSPYEQLKRVVKVLVHPGYVDSGFINDISLLQLDTPVAFSDYIRPVCLPQTNQPPADGRLCTVIGWGQLFEVGRIFPDTLQEVQIPIISTGECRKRTLFLPLYEITDDMFCAGYERGGRDACLGDSGGPLMCQEANGRWTLHGITSNGYGCARANRPGVYTKVANYLDWINANVDNDESVNVTRTKKNSCSGHRCPMGECLPENRLCNGYIECSDGSDEMNC